MRRPLYDQLVPYYEHIEGRDWRKEIKLIVSVLKAHEARTIVDLGCGTGYHVRKLAKLGFDATGVDISPRNIRFATNTARKERVRPKFIVGSYYRFRPREKVDAALCLNWSIPTRNDELRRFLSNTRSMLRVGGLLIVDFERVSGIVWKDVGRPIVNSWNLEKRLIVRVSVGQVRSNVLSSRDVYILYAKGADARAPKEQARYRAAMGGGLAEVYVDSSYVRFFSLPEIRRFAVRSGFRVIESYLLPRNGYKRNYTVLQRVS